MSIKIGINGFGRIGRNIFRAIDKDPAFKDIEIVAYCRGPNCVLSQGAVEILRENGIAAYRLSQGVVEWQLEGNKLEYSQHEISA